MKMSYCEFLVTRMLGVMLAMLWVDVDWVIKVKVSKMVDVIVATDQAEQ